MIHHLVNVGPDAQWKINKVRDKFPSLPLVYRDYPFAQNDINCPGYDEGVAIMNNLHSFGFARELSDQESFEFWQFWFNLRK